MKGRAIPYSAAERAFLQQHRSLPRRELHGMFSETFGRADVSMGAIKQYCLRQGWKTGRTGRFAKGSVPKNKGRKQPSHPNSVPTQFKPGREPKNTKYLGHERLTKDGYVEISVAQTNPYTGHPRRYVQKHRWLWEQANGPVPKGMCLKSLDGDKANTDPDNWICIPRAMLPRLNGRFGRDYDAAEPALKPVILKTTALEHQTRERRKEAG